MNFFTLLTIQFIDINIDILGLTVMFGFGNKTWKDSNDWLLKASELLNNDYISWFVASSMIFSSSCDKPEKSATTLSLSFNDFSKNFDMDESAILFHDPQQFVITYIWKTFSICVRSYKIKMVVWTYGNIPNPS